jgi:hypothetical protein
LAETSFSSFNNEPERKRNDIFIGEEDTVVDVAVNHRRCCVLLEEGEKVMLRQGISHKK